jgi:DNA-binding CsgD family transcriptional regulator
MNTTKSPYDAAIERIQRHLAELRTDEAVPIRRLKQKLDRVFGMLPLFPDQFLYVVNYTTGRVVHAQGFERVLGYPDASVDLPLIYNTWHPDDAPLLAAITERTSAQLTTMQPPMQPFEGTLTLDYRIRKANGDYIKVQRQTTVFDVDERTNRTTGTFSLCRDISNLKTSHRVGWQWEGRGAGDISFPELSGQLDYRPTARETEVLRRLALGKASKEIAAELSISEHTVSTHRRNLLQRTGLKNTAELIWRAVEENWI